jgi:hypothetical protein
MLHHHARHPKSRSREIHHDAQQEQQFYRLCVEVKSHEPRCQTGFHGHGSFK